MTDILKTIIKKKDQETWAKIDQSIFCTYYKQLKQDLGDQRIFVESEKEHGLW